MRKLNLIDKERSDIDYEVIKFPDGQDHIKMRALWPSDREVKIITRLTSASDLFILLQATEVLQSTIKREIDLEITYLLAARMDRRMLQGEPITLKVVANILNAQDYRSVKIFDPHSDVALTLIDRSEAKTNREFITDIVLPDINGCTVLVSPDAGAVKKINDLNQYADLKVAYATKTRSPQNGQLSGVAVDITNLNGETCLVVDDICDGGATFIGLAQELKKHNAGDLYLAVSHGIFSKGISPLTLHYKRVFTTNSYREQPDHTQLTTYKLW